MTANVMTQLVLPLALFCIMLGVGLTLQLADFRRLLTQPRAVLLGSILQLVFLPLLAALIVLLFQPPAVLAVGLMIVAFAPGGATSNMITFLARGDTALSVSLTALVSVVTPITLPLLSYLALQWQLEPQQLAEFPVLQTMLRLLLIALLPVLLGMAVRHWLPDFSQWMMKPVKWLSLLFLLIVVVGIVKANLDKLPSLLLQIGPAALALMAAAMVISYLVAIKSRLQSDQALTIAIEVGIQNAGTALLVTAGVLQNPLMSAAALSYGILMNIPALLLIAYRNLPQRRIA